MTYWAVLRSGFALGLRNLPMPLRKAWFHLPMDLQAIVLCETEKERWLIYCGQRPVVLPTASGVRENVPDAVLFPRSVSLDNVN
jgi:hypothetical protein